MLTPEDVALDYRNRREGVLKALVTDQDVFYETCDPEKENLCLYGNSDGSWEVALPAEEVPPEMPEPSLGINFARNGMQVKILYHSLKDGTSEVCDGTRKDIDS